MLAGFEQSQTSDVRQMPHVFDMPDPLDPDSGEDLPLLVTRRRLIRLALVAAETGARFQREGLDQDPVAWMLAPRELFGGRDGIEAALGLDGCLRAILLHGLSIGLDADPATVDDLLDDESGQPSPLMA
ncbi:hypothetical protein [Sphingomonas sp. Ant20]|jgi:hypothetical protein|uniref:hypothetical protein n=1 Tax=Sphingomonas sp. Ant20 TaxID=104605 RepID=UPI000A6E41CC|nr:hypothetical protein [Sphingomonas sp. Ant20]